MPRTGLTADEIREKAIDATVDRMRELGFEKVRLTDIAKDLDLSHAALYSHFTDKAALLDAVSARWLRKIDDDLATVCSKSKDPCEKILMWMLVLHRAKVEKVRNDPELFKAFKMSVAIEKPFARHHLETIHAQLLRLVKEAIGKRRLRDANAEAMTVMIREALIGFHHPLLVAQHIDEKREPLLRQVLDGILKGLNLKK